MTRPQIIRADTIDLQAHEATVSAQVHHRPTPDGSLAPHQAETLREVAAEIAEENRRSPRVSWTAEPDDIQQHALALDSAVQRHGSMDNMRAGAQQDALAIAQNGGLSGHDVDDGDLDGDAEVDMDDDMMDKISSSPSIEDEDIDFDFVYALHTFVATVEGQANATKGDTMVLLDDSNSYWWLVRVVKDSSIGYLPAEHIETPTERLARLNKHRNIDLSASMLTDQQDKARTTIRSAMKRRKAKTVQFAAPTYVDYSDIDYSTEVEDEDGNIFAPRRQRAQQTQQSEQSAADPEMEDETAKVEPLKPRSQKQARAESKKQDTSSGQDSSTANRAAARPVDELSETKSDGPKKTSDGTVRDSFFKDDTVETKKITLTPNLLRDDNGPRSSSETREVKQRPSLDKLEKDTPGKDDKKKKKDKEKDKKSGGIRGFFSRKDKKQKGEDDDDSFGKRSLDDAPEKEAEDEESQPSSPGRAGPHRQPSKLQKQMPRTEPSPTRKSNNTRENGMDVKTFLSEGRVNNVANVPPVSMRLVEASPESSPQAQRSTREASPKSTPSKAPRPEPRPARAIPARARAELDDSDSDEDLVPEPAAEAPVLEEDAQPAPRAAQRNPSAVDQAAQPAPAPAQTASSAPVISTPHEQTSERLSESPIQVSPVANSNPPPLVVDTSSHDEDRVSPRSTPSPELIEHEDAATNTSAMGHKSLTTPSTTRSESWDDASLRAFFDSGSDIRDLLVVVYDKNNVEPVGPEHPVVGGLFREQNAKLAEITTRLDDMLGDWLARKQRLRGSV
ncbi:hypothetical protein VTI74DRAFT_5361 [Chaetomium olivicolor]